MNSRNLINLRGQIPETSRGLRLDMAAAKVFSNYSRNCIQNWIKSGQLQINGKPAKIRDKIQGGELLTVHAPFPESVSYLAEPIDLEIIFEDEALLILNKPAGLVVHPAAGNFSGTLLNALLHHCPTLANLPRAGIIHRLDKDTTGILMVGKTLAACTNLTRQLQAHSVSREYLALAQGIITAGGSIINPIGRHPQHRTKMAVQPNGKPAITHYWVIERFKAHTLLKVQLETGRTHQIRVHLASIHHALVGDKTYGKRPIFPKQVNQPLKMMLETFPRQALHAHKLTLLHPLSQQECQWQVDLPDDFKQLLTALESKFICNLT